MIAAEPLLTLTCCHSDFLRINKPTAWVLRTGVVDLFIRNRFGEIRVSCRVSELALDAPI